MHMWLLSSSGQCKMQTTDCILQIGFEMQNRYKIQTAFKMQTETKIVASSGTRCIFNV